jgi:hypothetical protein
LRKKAVVIGQGALYLKDLGHFSVKKYWALIYNAYEPDFMDAKRL